VKPHGPRGEKRPADTIGCAVIVAKIATGEIEEEATKPSGKVRRGKAGAKARAEKLTAPERRDIAKQAAAVRWRQEGTMAALSLRGLFGSWYVKQENTGRSRKAAEFVRKAYKKTGGRPTPELERVYRTYTANQQRRAAKT